MLEKLTEKLAAHGMHNVQPIRLDLSQERWSGEACDVVVSSMTLHHIREADVVIAKLGAILKPGGYLALADLDIGSADFHQDDTGVEHSGFGAEQMHDLFTAAN